jgi:starch phosphorylase
VKDPGLSYSEAIEAVRAGAIFTTHTPVPAGIDRFPRELIERYFGGWASEVGISLDQLMDLGHRPGDAVDEPFNMAVMGLRLAGRSNGVAKLHGAVSREMFGDLWPDVPTDEDPIGSITNGVHAQTWVAPEMADLLTRHVLPGWHEAGGDRWDLLLEARDDELWRVREQGREQLVAFVRQRLRDQLIARGLSASDVEWTDSVLDPKALTICFARRFATYKRATLLLSRPERLRALLLSGDRPVQIVFAGKSHPADDSGKELIRQIVAFASDPEIRHRVVFVEDYDIAVARALLQGADVWLNNPRRPQEACGTSGMKAALNGALNLSILDGWWDECFDGENGWAISSAEHEEDLERRDEIEAGSLFELLERQVVPLFYERWQGPVPRRWVQRMERSLTTLGPFVTAARMVRDYTEQLYEPAAASGDALSAGDHDKARALAAWKARVRAAWSGVHVDHLDLPGTVVELGAERSVAAIVSLGDLTPADVQVQLIHGPAGQGAELADTTIVPMTPAGEADDGHLRYAGSFTCEQAGRYGATVRVVPAPPDLAPPLELGLIAWG